MTSREDHLWQTLIHILINTHIHNKWWWGPSLMYVYVLGDELRFIVGDPLQSTRSCIGQWPAFSCLLLCLKKMWPLKEKLLHSYFYNPITVSFCSLSKLVRFASRTSLIRRIVLTFWILSNSLVPRRTNCGVIHLVVAGKRVSRLQLTSTSSSRKNNYSRSMCISNFRRTKKYFPSLEYYFIYWPKSM